VARCLVTATHAQAFAAFAALAAALLVPGIGRGGTATLIDGKVRYKAAPGEANRIQVIFVPGEGIHVIDRKNSVKAGEGCISINTDAAFCERRRDKANLSLIRVLAGDRDDRVRILADARRVHLLGGGGPDDLMGGEGTGTNVLDGGLGADVLRASPSSDAWDVVDYSSRRRAVRATIGDGDADDGGRGEGDRITNGIEEVRGGFGNDVLKGEPNRDRLKGGRGQDTLRGRAGRDDLLGGRGSDVLRARDGDKDRVSGGIDLALDVLRAVEALF
jgi:Ca2+-binding RTX toxin-like protein